MWPYILHPLCVKDHQMQGLRQEIEWNHERSKGKTIETKKRL
jgi:hypothetical protein